MRGYLIGGGFLLAAGLLLALPAEAEIDGDCEGDVNGVSVADHGTVDDPIVLEKGSTVEYNFTADQGVSSWKVDMHYGPFSKTADEGANEGDQNSATGSFDVDDYAWMGVGLYEVTGTIKLADGSTCTGTVVVKIDGNPLLTLTGGLAAGATLGGGVGLGFSAWSAFNVPKP